MNCLCEKSTIPELSGKQLYTCPNCEVDFIGVCFYKSFGDNWLIEYPSEIVNTAHLQIYHQGNRLETNLLASNYKFMFNKDYTKEKLMKFIQNYNLLK